MKRLSITLLFTLLYICSIAAPTPVIIKLQLNKVCQIILPNKIEKIRGGFNPNLFVLDQYDNILYIQCLASFPNTNLSIITADTSCYMIDLFYADTAPQNAYIIELSDRFYRDSPATPTSAECSPTARPSSPAVAAPHSPDFATILKQSDFLFSANGIADKAMEVFVKGIYTRDNYVYIKIDITNNSALPYNYNYCGFAVVSKKKGKTSSYDRNDLTPIDSYIPNHVIEDKKTMTVIYKFDKFNYSNDRVLLIEMVEDNGDRGLYFKITSAQLLKARKI